MSFVLMNITQEYINIRTKKDLFETPVEKKIPS